MALTYTRAGAQAQLDAFDTALRAGAWVDAENALSSYLMIRAELPVSQGIDGVSQTWATGETLKDRLEAARKTAARARDNGRRTAVGRTSYGRR